MSDPRFLSVHLESLPRREEFRRARERVRGSCGLHTLAGDLRQHPGHSPSPTQPQPQDQDGRPPAGVTCWLTDGRKNYPLRMGVNSVGRLPDNDVVLDDPCVSRRHCAIVVHSDLSCEIHDVASKNGTCLNGRRLGGPTRLAHGDEIALCECRLTFVVADGAPTQDPHPRSARPSDDQHTLVG